MKVKKSRMEALKMLISSMELGSQEEVLQALEKEGFKLTQATLSRDLKQLKVAKAASMNGKYVYVLPNDTMYKRFTRPRTAAEMLQTSGFLSSTADLKFLRILRSRGRDFMTSPIPMTESSSMS